MPGMTFRAALAFALTTSAAGAQDPVRAEVRALPRRSVDTTKRADSLRVMVGLAEGDLMRLVADLMASRQSEEKLAIALRELMNDKADAATLSRSREIQAQLSGLARHNAELTSVIRLRCVRDEMQPEGYVGVNFVGVVARKLGDGPVLTSFAGDAQIVSVDPGSPAQKAGLEAHDQLVAIGGYETAKPIPLNALLKTGAKLPVRILREGKQRDLTLVVGKKTDDALSQCTGVDDMIAPARMAPQMLFLKSGRGDGTLVGGSAGAGRGAVSASTSGDGGAYMPRVGPGTGFAYVTPYPMSAPNSVSIWGAAFVSLDADWRETLKVDKGLLVTMVAPGSPARAAGLKPSDVVIAADDSTITSPGVLFRAVNAKGAAGVSLKVLRAGKPVIVLLKPREEP